MNKPVSYRLLIGAALGCFVAGILIVLGLRSARPEILNANLEHQLSGLDHDACVAAPGSWGWASGDMSFFAYERSGRSANPDAPRIEDRLLRQAIDVERVVSESSSGLVLFVVPYAPDGPCAVLRVTSRDTSDIVASRLLGVLAGAVVVGMLLTVFGMFWWVVRPLRVRINALATAAQHVGGDSFAPLPDSPDALGHIAEVLTRSHGRILDSRDALEARHRALEQHLASIAHDLRTPLASMHLALEALVSDARGPLQQEAQRALADAVYLSSMVENLHHGTRLRHQVEVMAGRVDFTELVRRLERRFAIVGRHAGIEVASNTPEQDVWVACTPALAERAVANLVQNAVEHNRQPGHVAITLSLVAAGSRFELLISDDGPGLSGEALASLQNETFLIEDARTRGPGMGMLITTEVARRAGWSVSYKALEPSGLQVRIEGPVADAHA